MKRKRFTPEQIAAVLKQAEMGVPIKDLCRQHSVTEQLPWGEDCVQRMYRLYFCQ